MQHVCIQCKHYQSSGTPNGSCSRLGLPVWSRRPQCAAAPPLDLFEPLESLGNQLRTARESTGLSRDDVCMELNISLRSLQNWETDTRKPPAHTVKMLMDYYKSKS